MHVIHGPGSEAMTQTVNFIAADDMIYASAPHWKNIDGLRTDVSGNLYAARILKGGFVESFRVDGRGREFCFATCAGAKDTR